MAISNVIESMTTNLSNAYSSVVTKGGTVPTNKNMENLSTAL